MFSSFAARWPYTQCRRLLKWWICWPILYDELAMPIQTSTSSDQSDNLQAG